jgi:RAB protein geranylgeranyltransferase component A
MADEDAYQPIEPTSFDVVVIGTGLVETLVAG